MNPGGEQPRVMALSPAQLRRELQHAGIANAAIDAVWPQWWSEDAASSVSATAELTYTVARRLGLSPRALFDGSAQFLWRDDTKFKKLDARSEGEEAALASFGIAVGRSALTGTEPSRVTGEISAHDLRQSLLSGANLIGAAELIYFCWAAGIPVIQLRVTPLNQKRMHAMTVQIAGRYAILLAHEYRYSAMAAYTLAHELGHILLGHLTDSDALLEGEDPLTAGDKDYEERAADSYALALLTGSSAPSISTDTAEYSATTLANTVRTFGPSLGIDPGVLALCVGHTNRKWQQSIGALKILQPNEVNVGEQINQVAARQIKWDALSFGNQEYLERMMGLGSDD